MPSWDKHSILPGVTALRLRAGECFVRSGITIHRGHASRAERLTIAGGWSAEMSDEDLAAAWANPSVIDVRRAWTMDPAVREALPTSWMRDAYDRWRGTVKLGTDEQDKVAGWVIETLRQRREAEATLEAEAEK